MARVRMLAAEGSESELMSCSLWNSLGLKSSSAAPTSSSTSFPLQTWVQGDHVSGRVHDVVVAGQQWHEISRWRSRAALTKTWRSGSISSSKGAETSSTPSSSSSTISTVPPGAGVEESVVRPRKESAAQRGTLLLYGLSPWIVGEALSLSSGSSSPRVVGT